MRLGIYDIQRFPTPFTFYRNHKRDARVACRYGFGFEEPPAKDESVKRRISVSAWLMLLCAVGVLCITSLAANVGCRKHPATPGVDDPLQVRLGYPADAKLLIINADDLAVAHSEDVASFAALDKKLVSSATVMVPCPWFTEVAAYAKSHPQADLGLHLTLTSEWDTYRWGPIAPRALVPSLVGPDGFFYSDTDSVAKHARPDEVEIELRAQIERAKSAGLNPSHLDAHMHALYRTPELFDVFLRVAHDYRLPIRMARNDELFSSKIGQMQRHDPKALIPDAIYSPGAEVPADHWVDYYVNLIKNLQPGVTEIFVHLAHDDPETQAIMINHADWGAAWRQREFDAISNPAIRKALDENHVILIGWRDIKKLLE